MCENNSGNHDGEKKGMDLGEELGRLFKMGVGAVAGAVEKGAAFVDELTTEGTEANKRANDLGADLARKGEEVFGKTVQLGSQIKDKVVGAVNRIPVGFENVISTLEELSGEQLGALRDKIDQIIERRNAEPEPEAEAGAEAEAPADDQEQ